MKPIIILICTVMVLSFAAYGCKGKASNAKPAVDNQAPSEIAEGYRPSEKQIVDAFTGLWYDIHGEKGEKGSGWHLSTVAVGGVKADQAAKTATINIKFTYKPGSKPQKTKAADFLFREVDGIWTIDKDTAKYPITP